MDDKVLANVKSRQVMVSADPLECDQPEVVRSYREI